MTAEKEGRKPLQIKNLADLKRHIKVGTELAATYHANYPDIVGLTRVVTKVQTNGFYSVIKNQPNHRWSGFNYGKGGWPSFEKASLYHFNGSSIQVLNARKNDGIAGVPGQPTARKRLYGDASTALTMARNTAMTPQALRKASCRKPS